MDVAQDAIEGRSSKPPPAVRHHSLPPKLFPVGDMIVFLLLTTWRARRRRSLQRPWSLPGKQTGTSKQRPSWLFFQEPSGGLQRPPRKARAFAARTPRERPWKEAENVVMFYKREDSRPKKVFLFAFAPEG